jgi:IPT/TIG domain
MKLSFAISLLVAASCAAFAQQAMPRMATVDPQNGKTGDVLMVSGENLQKDAVTKLYLTDGTNDTPVEITEQNATTIKFKIPAKCKPGRLALMVLTGGKEPKLIEQPVKVTVEEQ